MSKRILTAYFSASGATKRAAQKIAEAAQSDLFEIEPTVKYTPADLNWNDKHSRSSVEMSDRSSRPSIKSKLPDMDKYDVIFVGFPIWWYVAPTIINTFLESYDFAGKTIVPFATSGSSGMGETEKYLRASCSDKTEWRSGKRLRGNETTEELEKWIESLNL